MSSVKVIVKGKARSRIALGVVAAYLRLHPNTTFKELKEVFPDSICPKAPVQFRSLVPLGVFQPLDLVQSLPEIGLATAHYIANNEILNTADGVTIAVTKSWTQEAFKALSIAAATHGIAIMTVGEGEKWHSGTYELDFVDIPQPPQAAAPTAPPPIEEPQPEILDDRLHQAAKKRKVSKGKTWLRPLPVTAVLVLIAVTALLHRSGCFGIFGSKVVDTIIIETNEVLQPIVKESNSVKKAQAAVKNSTSVAQDSTPAPQPKAAAPVTVTRKKGKGEVRKRKEVKEVKKMKEVKKEVKKVEKVERVEKVNEVEKAGKVEKVERVEKTNEVVKVEKKEEKANEVKKVEEVEQVEKAERQENVQPTEPKEKKRYSQEPLF